MNIKITIGLIGATALIIGSILGINHILNSEKSSNPKNIVTDYKNLLLEANKLKTEVGDNCENSGDIGKRLISLEKQLSNLRNRKNEWLDNVPKLPDVEPEKTNSDNPLGRPGSEIPELDSNIPPLPEIPGSQVPELSSDVPPLPEVKINGADSEFIPEMPELNTGRPGSEVPDLNSDAPPLPEIDIINSDEYVSQMDNLDEKISALLQELKTLCKNEATPVKQKVISDKCSDACQRHKDCTAYTEDVTPTDLQDAYDACMEECPTWPKEMVKCINKTDIKITNDCVSFVNCRLPQYYDEKYSQ